MKNIHVLPTDKPSRLVLDDITQQLILINKGEALWGNRNIYITNDEEINQNTKPCWCLNTIKKTWNDDVVYFQGTMPQYHYIGFKKIILTDNTDLIKDGVQAIPDEFLEWFVKNPSCEDVAINTLVHEHHFGFDKHKNTYKLIIPKEEPKQSIILDLIFYKDEEAQKDVEIDWSGFPKSTQEQVGYVEPKQETLEEVVERLTRDFPHYSVRELMADSDIKYWFLEALDKGAKWQQEQEKQKYSKEDLKKAFNDGKNQCWKDLDEQQSFKEWFEQFKK